MGKILLSGVVKNGTTSNEYETVSKKIVKE